MAQGAARGLRRAVADAEWTIAVFWIAGAVVVSVVIPSHRWHGAALPVLVGAVAAALAMAGLRGLGRGRLPRWTLQADLVLGTLLVTGIQLVGHQAHVSFAPLYIWVPLYAALFFSSRSVAVHVAAVAAALLLTLVVAGVGFRAGLESWMEIIATAVLAGAVVTTLVGQLRELALHDALTGLPNRRAWRQRLELERERAGRAGSRFGVAILDLDNFKGVNDRGGHAAGDRALTAVAAAWQDAIRRGSDLLARIGGDEFGLVAAGTDAAALTRLTERLVVALPPGLSVCAGTAVWDGTESDDDLVRRADRAMYEMKQRPVTAPSAACALGTGGDGAGPPGPGG